MGRILIRGPKDPASDYEENHWHVDTTSRSKTYTRFLSPFLLGPVEVPGNEWDAENVENAWQFSKVYPDQVDNDGNITKYWKRWACGGWCDKWAHRYPKGKGAVPVGCHYDGLLLGYVEARKKIYVPAYTQGLLESELWQHFVQDVHDVLSSKNVVLWDFDGYNCTDYEKALNDETRPMGHAFIIREELKKVI